MEKLIVAAIDVKTCSKKNDLGHYLLLLWIPPITSTLHEHAVKIQNHYDGILVSLESIQVQGSSTCVAGTTTTLREVL